MPRLLSIILVVGALAACRSAPPPPPPAPTPPLVGPALDMPPPKQIVETARLAIIPRHDLFASPDHVNPRLSPDGKHLTWLAPVDGILNVWVASPSDPSSAKAITHDTRRGIRDYTWTYDGKHVLYSQDTDGDENWHVLLLDVTTGVSRDATAFQSVRARIVGLSPEHRGTVLIGLNRRDPEWQDVFELDIEKATLKPYYENKAHLVNLSASYDYKVLAGEHVRDNGAKDVVIVDVVHKRPPRVVTTIPFEDSETSGFIDFSGDGRAIYLLDSRGRDTNALVTLDVATGKTRVLANDQRSDVSHFIQHPLTRAPRIAFFEYDVITNVIIDTSISADMTTLRAVEPSDFTWTGTTDDKQWVVTFKNDIRPARFYLYDRETREARFLFSERSALDDAQLGVRRAVIIPARDGVQLVGYLTLPFATGHEDTQLPARPLPMVLLVHGGPWSRDALGFDSTAQWLANRGYAVLQVNFRGSTGFGKHFVNLGNLAWGGAMQDDLLDAVKWAVDQCVTTAEQVAIFGGSYGGYATLSALATAPTTFRCGIDIVGPSSLETFIAAIPPYWKPYLSLLYDRIGDPRTDAGRTLLHERSPLTHAAAIERPLLIAQGANDPRVKRAESDQLVEALREHQVPVTYVLFPDEGHGFARPVNRLAFFALAEKFLAEQLGGRAQPPGVDGNGASMQVIAGPEAL